VAPQRALMQMVSAIVDLDGDRPRGERVELLVRTAADEAAASALLGPSAAGVRFHRARYGDVWLRDTGPIFVVRDGELSAARFRFDGWGGKYLMDGDPELGAQVMEWAGVRGAAFDFVLEGGAIEVDGDGTVLTTRQCMLGGARQPGPRSGGARCAAALGARRRAGRVARSRPRERSHRWPHRYARALRRARRRRVHGARGGDPNHDALAGIIADLRTATSARGGKLEVVTVPSPGAVLDASGMLMPRAT